MRLRYIKFGLFLAASGNFQVLASPVSLPPVDIPVGPDSQVRIAISNTDPNLFVVPGDRIIAVDSVQGMFVNANKAQGQANGGVVLMTTQSRPFTFYLRTAGGLTVSVIGLPQKRQGRVLHFISGTPAQNESTRQWERSQPYLHLLTDIQKAVLKGKTPQGFLKAPVVALPRLQLTTGLKVKPVDMWSGGELRLYRLNVRNTDRHVVAFTETLFQAQGVRAVMIFPFKTRLMPDEAASVWMTASSENEDEKAHHGQY
ncbi:type-F conjugative transfer system secretin TraK [Enterobacter kobei]|uniref:type-F conjugative transfer system secretin TraK n=1 Tax=Enterobacter cloacae complex TaxID=354276 RepID=UPI00062C9ABE|nr:MULTISPECIES: type-F conjugative transfer system secretin TraK [Enterobacter cloacae complex]MCK7113836.1 type-F conjugative transfer system secretin TraK [Enterobacter kobei]